MVHWLSFHAPYRCRHAGDCCTAGWPIPVEVETLNRTRAALASGLLSVEPVLEPFAFPNDAPPETPALLGISRGACAFYEPRSASGSCNLQHALGHEALPLACRQFPRVSVVAGGRVSVTLSHYCPTARGLLDLPGTTSVVTAPKELARDYVGLEVNDFPPLLRPGLLMDWDGWWQWEALSVRWLSEMPADRAIAGLRFITDRVRQWVPGSDGLPATIQRAFTEDCSADAQPIGPNDIEQRVQEVLAAVPEDLRPARSTLAGLAPSAFAHQRFLAAHAFANWTAYLGQGLRTWLRSIEAADALIRSGLGIREADLLLRHLADPNRLARIWSEAESE